jgi:signal transduction histidine kinase
VRYIWLVSDIICGIAIGVDLLNGSSLPDNLYDIPDQLKLQVLVILVCTGIFLEGVVHYLFHISVVYTQFYYLIIVVAGLLFGRTVVAIALFFGCLEVAVSWIIEPGIIPYDAILRALMLVIVAVVIWKTVEKMTRYHDLMLAQNRELKEMNLQLDTSQKAVVTANKKLNLLSGITRHDIRNQLTALLAYIELSRMSSPNPGLTATIDKEEMVANNILRQIEFTKTYEDIGVNSPQWSNVAQLMALISPVLDRTGVGLSISTENLEIYADPLFEKVFENLVDNSRRHGEHVRQIIVSYERRGASLILVYSDDGAGIPDNEKDKIFEKGYGKNTGLGLFISREILSITGLSIHERGTFGNGARFEIEVPEGSYRFGEKPEAAMK